MAHNPDDVEKWMSKMGTKFADVLLYIKGHFIDERHVDDPDTLNTTVSMSLERLGGRYAIWQCVDGHWQVFDHSTNLTTCYPSRAAAEMKVIHAKPNG